MFVSVWSIKNAGINAAYEELWKDDNHVGVEEAARLMREYRENQEMIDSLGGRFYQIIYPVQLRHHEKIGISTREAPAAKGRGDDGRGAYIPKGASRHYHRTSLLIKSFSHKFRLDLELNTQLLAPNLLQKHYLHGGAEQVSKQEIEHCYYHGTVKELPGAIAALRTCNGVSGILQFGNETFVIQPFVGGDLSRKHPHVFFDASSKVPQKCANLGVTEWGLKRHRSVDQRRKRHQAETSNVEEGFGLKEKERVKRDIREVTKYVEVALVVDKAMFDRRNGTTRMEVVHDAIQIANIADLYFKSLNTRLSVVYIETWANENQAKIDPNKDISQALFDFNNYISRRLYKVSKDTTQLLTGLKFSMGDTGMSVPDSICTSRGAGISVDINIYEPHVTASTMAHMIGHNMGMTHDDNRENCKCKSWHGCIMSKTIVGDEYIQPYTFSDCSLDDYVSRLRKRHGLESLGKCGNGVVEEGEECDCGVIDQCEEIDPCCDPITCRLKAEAECSQGPCCHSCRLRPAGHLCRPPATECDIPEYCDGVQGQCPLDIYKKNGNKCDNGAGYCFNGICPSRNTQCQQFWGFGGTSAEVDCYAQFNQKGWIYGHCGRDYVGNLKGCRPENVMCGTLQCQMGNRNPVQPGNGPVNATVTRISFDGKELECKAIYFNDTRQGIGLVMDGTACDENKICVNQTCTSIYPYVSTGQCPSNHVAFQCSGHGVCSNVNTCVCDAGWGGGDCSIPSAIQGGAPPTPIPAPTPDPNFPPNTHLPPTPQPGTTQGPSYTHTKQTETYDTSGTNTVFMVIVLVSVVGGVFILFALMALCYRSVVVHSNLSLCLRRKSSMPRSELPYPKKPIPKKLYGGGTLNAHGAKEEETAFDAAGRIITFGTMPSYSGEHLMGPMTTPHYGRRTLQGGSRHPGGLADDSAPCDWGGVPESELVSFIQVGGLDGGQGGRIPEKGILKKPMPMDEHDSQELLSGSDHQLDTEPSVPISEVERTLKSMNGYHEDILDALRSAATQRAVGGYSSAGSGPSLSDEHRKSLSDGYPDYSTVPYPHSIRRPGSSLVDEDEVPPCGPIRIRNLKDLLRQLESGSMSGRHLSPNGSEDLRTGSEPEADRGVMHTCTSSSLRPGLMEEESVGHGFVYGRYRGPSSSSNPRSREDLYQSPPDDRDNLESDGEEYVETGTGSGSRRSHSGMLRSGSEEALVKGLGPGQVAYDSSSPEPQRVSVSPRPTPPPRYYASPPSDGESFPGSLDDSLPATDDSRDRDRDVYPEYTH
ncbi:unnamed protein product [Darwinula stevensoni]|uniref:Disintegrin and metalloproteinase domain-containing protein 11 n=1 Tax=Darwinula stevensoni TaxID=69355 RepID=A0A7R9A4W6_9CRUS|nr:unnamed protein product [Darwinula stevensoni]CAG0885167.1 unnamed protein product [Darwinula stevensoni]